ncbi:MAG: DNA cytosine methyltransferase [Bacteriovoracia bacterium]
MCFLNQPQTLSGSYPAIELFSGAGGLSLGLERAGFKVCIANEIEKVFAQTFKLNHPHTKVIQRSVEKVDFKQELDDLEVKQLFLLSGGPPCQGFSTVGSKKKDDPRNILFQEYLRAIKETNPFYVLFENVAGFKKLYNGHSYHLLLEELDGLGYYTNSSILDASDFGLPQKRLRTIVVGWRKDLARVRLPLPTHCDIENIFAKPPKLCLMDAISDLPPLISNDSSNAYLSSPRNDYQRKLRGSCKILTEHNSSNYGKKMREILRFIPVNGCVEDLPVHLRPKKYFKNTYARLSPNKPAPTITRNFGTPSSSRCVHPFQDRALSTREGARLQGFPDAYVFCGNKCSKNLQIGNSVPPVFGEIIAAAVMESIISSGIDTSVALKSGFEEKKNCYVN